ncbi:MAG: hypothetical protein JZU67_01115 [Burkholderiaceae bacterium]|nr:hypothetical protein [Burkholderiaceae bacterium]
MRITESQLRKIVKKEIVLEAARRSKPIMYLTQYGHWRSVSPEQWPALLAAGVADDVNIDELATYHRYKPRDVVWHRDRDGGLNLSASIPIYEPLDFGPDDWEWLDSVLKSEIK